MIKDFSKRATTVALVTAGSVAAFGFAGAAQAASLAGTLAISGTAEISPWGTTDPMLKAVSVTAVNGGTGQFTGATMADPPATLDLTGTPSGSSFNFVAPQNVADFIKVVVSAVPPGAGYVIGDITSALSVGTFAGSATNNTTNYTVIGDLNFREPNGFPSLLGTFSITYTRSVTTPVGGSEQVSQSYALSLQKTDQPAGVPEPSAILGILAVAGVGAFARRKS